MTAKKSHFVLEGKIVDIVNRRIFKGRVHAKNGKIVKITETDVPSNVYLLPGLIDAHVHIESSMLIPSEFARLAVPHGTVATVSDPHEIANVLGYDGVRFMIENGKRVPFKFFFGAPSCVPATPFESAGAVIDSGEIEKLMQDKDIYYLAEMMNFPGVLHKDDEVMKKLAAARKYQKPVDGHAPGLKGDDARAYAAAGISTDHECFTMEEALDKIDAGMKIQIREGSAAKNFDALIDLVKTHPDKVMFCSDDKHPDNLTDSHINKLVAKAINLGYDEFDVLRAAILNPKEHYNLPTGLLRVGDPADVIVVDRLDQFNVLETYIDGQLVAMDGQTKIETVSTQIPNHFQAKPLRKEQLQVKPQGDRMRVIKAIDGQLVTESFSVAPKIKDGLVVSDTDRDILKLVVLNRYTDTPPAIAFINKFQLKQGAIASSVAHDSHNIIAVGADDESIVAAVNEVIKHKGGVSCTREGVTDILPLPVAGIMSDANGYWVAEQYAQMDQKAKSLGSMLGAPYMTLAFMALLVIPALKLSDKGLFDGIKFQFENLFYAE
jgi:adenine deaminase